MTEHHNFRHGHRAARSPEYRAWQSMLGRCYCKTAGAYPRYGARGVTVVDAWRGRGGFEQFLAHIGPKPSPRHSLDRIDRTQPYGPGNVRWATGREQNINRDIARTLTLGGVTKPVDVWAAEKGLEYATVMRRIYAGHPPEVCLSTTPLPKPGRPRRRAA